MTTLSDAVVEAPRKILVTGSSGYVGQHLITSLAFNGVNSTNHVANDDTIDDTTKYDLYLAYNSLATFERDLTQLLFHNGDNKLHPSIGKVNFIAKVDFAKSDYVDIIQQACCEKGEIGPFFDVIIHLAALSSPAYCEIHQEEAWKVNVPIDLLSFRAPIIYLSTDQVYEGMKSFYREDGIDETIPVNIYGQTKLAFERVLLNYPAEKGYLLSEKELTGSCTTLKSLELNNLKKFTPNPKSVILRSSLILGKPTPLIHGCRKGSFPSFLQFIENRLQTQTPTEYFDNEYRSMVHINDVITSISHFLHQTIIRSSTTNSNAQVRVYNLGGSARLSRYELALAVANHLKLSDSSIVAVNRPSMDGNTACVPSPPDISMNVRKITQELALSKMDGLDEIIRATFDASES